MDAAEVRKVAALSRLTLTESELPVLAQQLTGILDYVRLLDEVDLVDVEPMPHAIHLQNVFRDDCPVPSLSTAAALANAPQSDGSYFLVPQILEEKTRS